MQNLQMHKKEKKKKANQRNFITIASSEYISQPPLPTLQLASKQAANVNGLAPGSCDLQAAHTDAFLSELAALQNNTLALSRTGILSDRIQTPSSKHTLAQEV